MAIWSLHSGILGFFSNFFSSHLVRGVGFKKRKFLVVTIGLGWLFLLFYLSNCFLTLPHFTCLGSKLVDLKHLWTLFSFLNKHFFCYLLGDELVELWYRIPHNIAYAWLDTISACTSTRCFIQWVYLDLYINELEYLLLIQSLILDNNT
jgi:hypothetical protein